jgi:hypothetical protein
MNRIFILYRRNSFFTWLNGASVAPTSQARASAMLLLAVTDCRKLKMYKIGVASSGKIFVSHFISTGVKVERLKGDAYKHQGKKSKLT